MKTWMKIMLALCLALMLLFAGTLAEDSPVGLWYMHSVQDGDEHIDALENGVYIIVEIHENGRATTRSMDGGKPGEELTGLWKEENGQISVTMDGMTIMAHMEDGYLVFTEDDGVIEHMARLDRAAVANMTGRWRVLSGVAENDEYTPETEEVLLLRDDWTAQYWVYDQGGMPSLIQYGNWQLAEEGRLFVTIEGETAIGRMENRQMKLSIADRSLMLDAPDTYRENGAVQPEEAAADVSLAGEWQVWQVVVDGQTYDAVAMGMDTRFYLHADGTAQGDAQTNDGSLDQQAEGSWSYENGTVAVTLDNETVYGEYRDGKILLYYDEETNMTLGRIGETAEAQSEAANAAETTVDVLGEWKLEGAIVRGEYIAAADRNMEANIVLHADGTASGMTAIEGENQGVAEGSWRWAGQKLGITLDGEEVLCSLEDGKMIAHYDSGQEMVFGR